MITSVNGVLSLLDVCQTYLQRKYQNLFVAIRYPNQHHEISFQLKFIYLNEIFKITLTTFGLVKTLFRVDNSSRSVSVSIKKSSVRDDICIKHVKP
jgi:hypothetical protein